MVTVLWTGIKNAAHIIYGSSWIRQLMAREVVDVRVAVLPSRTFFTDEPITCDDIAAYLPEKVEVVEFTGQKIPRSEKIYLLSVGAVGIKPWLWIQRRYPLHRIPVIVTDEGLGTYGNWRSRHEAGRRQGVAEPWNAVRTTAVTGATRALATSRWALHVQRDGEWMLNAPVAAEFRRHASAPESNNQIVFLSQPWPEVGVLGEEQYVHHVEAVARLCEGQGCQFFVAPHPGEAPDRYANFEVLSDSLSELSPQVLGARALVGASTTAMLNVAAIHGVPAFRVGTPELRQLDRAMSPKQASLMSKYVASFTNIEGFGRRLSQWLSR